MKKLLVLAAGILQIPIIQRAREMGYCVIAADGDMNACGLQYADKAVVANITSEEEMLRIAHEEKIDGVIHPCSEVSMTVMGRINDELGLSGISRAQAVSVTDKHQMRKAFEASGVASPESFCTDDVQEAWRIFSEKLEYDAILKPSRNSGSRGIARITREIGRKEFDELFDRSKNESRDNCVMIEQFIDGPEFSVEIIVWQNEVSVLAVTDKKTTEIPYFVELGHNQPSCFPENVVKEVKKVAIDGVKALGVNNCACHAEIKVRNDKAFIIEIGARMGGDFIATVLTKLSTGIDMTAAAINCALGIEPLLKPTADKHGVCIRYFCPNPGKLIRIDNTCILEDARVYDYSIYRKDGDIIPEVTSSLCRSGHVIVTEETPQKAIALAEKLTTEVKFETE